MKQINWIILATATIFLGLLAYMVNDVCAQTGYTNYLDTHVATQRDGTIVSKPTITTLSSSEQILSDIKLRLRELHVIRELPGITPAQKTTLINIELDTTRLIKLINLYDVLCMGLVELDDLEATYKQMLWTEVFGDHYK